MLLCSPGVQVYKSPHFECFCYTACIVLISTYKTSFDYCKLGLCYLKILCSVYKYMFCLLLDYLSCTVLSSKEYSS
mgnify:CR=1 FL=1